MALAFMLILHTSALLSSSYAQPCSPCHQDATCIGTTCECNTGFTGDGTSCQDDPPVFVTQCPGNISRVADPSSTSTSVAWTDPTATDVVDGGSVDVTCDPLSGNQFLIGTHQVTCTATDSGGRSRTCSFEVIITDFNECTAPEGSPGRHDCVNAVCGNTHGGFTCTCNAGYSKPNDDDHTCTDTEPPVFTANTCPPSTSHIAEPSSMVTTVTWSDPTATDSTGVTPSVECAPASGTDFAIGQTPVTCTATDAAGNKASPDCTFTVTVTDFNECTAQEGSPGRHNCVNAVCGDIDGGFTCTCNTGYNKLNQADHTCRDVTPPVFTATPCQSPVTQVADPNSMTSTSVTWTTPAATDSTGVPPTVTCTPSTNDAFSIGNTPVTCTATDAAGNRAENDCTFTVTVTEVPEVGGVDAEAISATEIEVTWEVTYDGNALPFMCKVDFKDSESLEWTLGPFAEEPSLSRPVTNLIPYTVYDVRVTCQNRAGDGVEVTRQDVVTTLQAAPDAPENVRVTARTSTSLSVVWDAPTVKRGTIAYYVVTVDSALDEPVSRQTPGPGNPAPRTLVLDQLSPYRNYTIYVTAFNVEGNNDLMGDDSDTITHRTAESTPSPPVNVLLDNEGATCILTWDPPEEETGIILSYTIYRNAYLLPDGATDNVEHILDSESSDSVVTDSTARSHSVQKDDLPAYTRYRFQVSASTAEGEGPVSQETETTCDTTRAVPDELQPPMVPDSSQNQITDTAFKVTVGPISQRNGPVSCVEVTVVRLEDEEGIEGKAPDVLYHPDIYRTYDVAQELPGLPYVASVLEGNELLEPTDVVVGGGGRTECVSAGSGRRRRQARSSVHEGDNGPLTPSTKYTTFVRAYVVLDTGEEAFSTSPLLQPVWTAKAGDYTAVIAVVSVLSVALLIAVLIGCGVFRKRRKRDAAGMPSTRGADMEMASSSIIKDVEYEVNLPGAGAASTVYEDVGLPSWALRWEIVWKNLAVDDNVLGRGNFGEVRSGRVKVGGRMTKAAIKILKGHASKMDRDDFMEELRTMTSIGYHPNVVSLLGACQREDILYVALEYLPNGDLRSYLRTAREQSESDEGALSSDQLIKFAVDIAKGMNHLSMSGVIHRDLAARNILLSETLVAKVSDFGLSRGEDIYIQTSLRRVPTRWLAIESVLDRTYTTQSDVWSFGILLWEIASIGGTPYPSIATKALANRLMEGYRMSKPANCDEQIYSLMLRCWKAEPGDRPTFGELIRILSRMEEVKNEQKYMAIDRSHYENFCVIRPELDDN